MPPVPAASPRKADVVARDLMRRIVSGELVVGSLRAGGVVQAFGTGHSEALAMEFAGRAGGLVPTNRISMYLTVEASDDDVVVVRANLNDGHVLGSTFRLDGGDYLRACMGGVCRSMADNDSIFTPDYIARFSFQSGVDYVVSFNRQEGRNAPDTRAALPPSFDCVSA